METFSADTIPDETIIHKIFVIRGLKVMLDKDLAALYRVGTRDLNKAVKRNPRRFQEDFMFQLTQTETGNLMFQNGTSSWGGRRKRPYVFTEQGKRIMLILDYLKSLEQQEQQEQSMKHRKRIGFRIGENS